ncbi:MAG: protein kinase [Acidobacteriota bacterium]
MSDAPTQPVLCSRCGRERTPGGRFCPHCGAVADGTEETLPLHREPAASAPARIGEKFEILRELGRGGFGTVYEARDTLLDRRVAIKTFREDSFTSAEGRDAFEKRFLREARNVARLSHPGIVTLHDAGQSGGTAYLVMELVVGRTLRSRLDELGRLPLDEAMRIGGELLAALAYAHGEGVVHRDVKPENVILREDGSVKVADFGVAKALGTGTPTLTEAGTMVGTPSYMPPEQIRGHEIDGRADQYSAAALIYEVLTGRRAFVADSIPALMYKILHESPEPPHRIVASVPEAVSLCLMRALARAPEERWASCEDLRSALARAHRGELPTVALPAATPAPSVAIAGPVRPRSRASPLALGGLLAGGAAVAALWLASRPAPAPADDPERRELYEKIAKLEGSQKKYDDAISALATRQAAPSPSLPAPPALPTDADRAAQTVAKLATAFEKGDLDGAMALFDPEAHVELPDHYYGVPDIRGRLKALLADPAAPLRQFSVARDTLTVEDDVATVEVVMPADSGPPERLIRLRRSGSGVWRVKRIEPNDAVSRAERELDLLLEKLAEAGAGPDPSRATDLFTEDAAITAAGGQSTDVASYYRIASKAGAPAFGLPPAPGTRLQANVSSVTLVDDLTASARVDQFTGSEGRFERASYRVTFRKGPSGWRIASVRETDSGAHEDAGGTPEAILTRIGPHFARKDAGLAAADFEPEGTVVLKDGTVLRGAAQIQAFLEREFARGRSDWSIGYAGPAVVSQPGRFVFEYEPSVLVDGKRVPRRFRMTLVEAPAEVAWRIREMRELD